MDCLHAHGFISLPTCGLFNRPFSCRRCSAAEDVRASAIVSSSSEASLSFTVGITEVTTRVVDGTFPYLTHMHIGGYDLDTTGADIVFESKGPFG